MKYDEQVLHENAEKLYKQAEMVIITTAVEYGVRTLVVSFIGVAVVAVLGHIDAGPLSAAALILTLIAVIGGIAKGRERSFHLRLEAQRVLVLAEIERNTRKLPESGK
jgi:hypothetical protein